MQIIYSYAIFAAVSDEQDGGNQRLCEAGQASRETKKETRAFSSSLLAYTTSHRLPSISKKSQMKTRLVEVRIGTITAFACPSQ